MSEQIKWLDAELIAELPARYETDTILGNVANVGQSNSASVSGDNGDANAHNGGLLSAGNSATGGTVGHAVQQTNTSSICQRFQIKVRF